MTLTVLLNLFLSSDTSICSRVAIPPLGNYDHIVVSVSVDFPSNSKRDFIIQLMTILVLIVMFFVIIGEIFHGRISLKLVVLLWLLLNFVSGSRLELMYLPLKPHSCAWFSAACAAPIATSFITNIINLLDLKGS